MAVIFEGTFAELQQQIPTLTLPLEKQVFLVDNTDAMQESSLSADAAVNPLPELPNSLTLDQIKEMAEDDDEYFLRFYRAS